MRIYLSGPMRGKTGHNYAAFDQAEARWRAAGHCPLSPARLSRLFGLNGRESTDDPWIREVLSFDLAVVARCEAIALLPDWEQSLGATAEVAYAMALGLIIYNAETMEPMNIPVLPYFSHCIQGANLCTASSTT